MDPIIFTALLLIGFVVAFAIGSNDEAMAPAVGARVFSVTTAVVLGGVLSIIGAVFFGGGVSEKVGSELVSGNELSIAMVFAMMISMAIWLLLASASKGLPISTTQCIVGAVIGIAVVAPFLGKEGWGIAAIDWSVILQILGGWVLSPIVGFVISAAVFRVVRKFQSRAKGFTDRERQEKVASYGLAFFLIIVSLSRGGNDVANAVAPLVVLPDFQGTFSFGPFAIPGVMVPLLIGGIGMALGLIVVGRKVIKTLANEVVTLTPMSALSASISVALVMFVGTYLGLPLSGTHVLVAALIAVGWVSRGPIQMKQVKAILISWVVTVPISAIIAVIVYVLLNPFFPMP